MTAKKKYTFGVDAQATLDHLCVQFCAVLRKMMDYKDENVGLDFTIVPGKKPWRFIVVWTFEGHQLDEEWQAKVFAKMSKLVSGKNLFAHPINKDNGDYITEVRVDKYEDLMLRDDLPEVPPHCNFD